jgi:hypothetical protein
MFLGKMVIDEKENWNEVERLFQVITLKKG